MGKIKDLYNGTTKGGMYLSVWADSPEGDYPGMVTIHVDNVSISMFKEDFKAYKKIISKIKC